MYVRMYSYRTKHPSRSCGSCIPGSHYVHNLILIVGARRRALCVRFIGSTLKM